MVRIYIHGRPQGQDIWSASPNSNDEFYLKPFLGSKIGENMDAVLQVDMWQQGSYYSYIHRKNVMEKSNRPNAYFAITICFEKQYCTQVSTLYDLLDAIYQQLCLNDLIEKNGDQEHFLITQFQEKEGTLRKITDVIQQNIEKHLSNSLEPIEKKTDTISAQIKSYSTVDVDSPQFISDCQNYRVLIAPSFTSKDRLPQELQQKIAAIESQKAELQQEKDRWQSDAEHSHKENEALADKQKELNGQIAKLQEQVGAIRDEVRNEYESAAAQLQTRLNKARGIEDDLKSKLSKEQDEKSALSSQVEKLKNQVEELKEHINRLRADTSRKADSTAIANSVGKPEDHVRRIEKRPPHSHSRFAFAFGVVNTAILIVILSILLMGKTRIDRIENMASNKSNPTIVNDSVNDNNDSADKINSQDDEEQQ